MRTLTLIIALLPLLGCPSADTAAAGDPDSHPPQESCAFSFVILTDTHIGEGVPDYGTEGWDDGPGGSETSPAEAELIRAVEQTNALAAGDDPPAFVVVLGDLTGSGERSELLRTRELLDELTLPWLPLLGNHDAWPYAWDASSESWNQADSAVGDAFVQEVFEDSFAQAAAVLPSLVLAPSVVESSIGRDTPFVTFAWSHCGLRFVALDTNSRTPAPGDEPGIGPEADLFTGDGAPWSWMIDDLTTGPGSSAETAVVFAHHPFTNSELLSFRGPDFQRIEADLEAHGLDSRIAAFFGGHLHVQTELEGPLGLPVVLTGATKEGAEPRVIRVSEQGELDWDD